MQVVERSQLRKLLSSDDFNRQRGVAMSITVSISAVQSSPIRRTLTQMRCRTVAVNLCWYRSLWALTILAVESPTNLFVASHWLERSSCRFVVTLLVFSRADYSILQVLTTSHVVFISTFYWRLASKASIIIFPLIGSPAVTSHAAVNSDARSIQIFSQNIRLRC